MVVAERGVAGGVAHQMLASTAAAHTIWPVRLLLDSQHSPLYGHCLVVTLVVRTYRASIFLDLSAMDARAKASGIICLVGLGVGIGSMFLYRLYRKVVAPTWKEDCKRPHNPSSLEACQCRLKSLSPKETPDSGFSSCTADTQHSAMNCDGDDDHCRYYPEVVRVGSGILRSRKRAGSAPPGGGRDHVARFTISPTEFHEITDEENHHGGHDQNGNHAEYPVDPRVISVDGNGNEGFSHVESTPCAKPMMTWADREAGIPRLMRQRGSYGSDLSNCTYISYADSVDCQSDITGCSDLFRVGSLSSRAESNMEEIQNELKGLRQDISDINEAVQMLNSHENLCSQRSYTLGALEACQPDVHTWQIPSQTPTDVFDETQNKRAGVEFMWDYQSDLGSTQDNFMVHRPLFENSSESSGSQSPNRPISSVEIPLKVAKRGLVRTLTNSSITGIFIDDEINEDSSIIGRNSFPENLGGYVMKDSSKEHCSVGVQYETSEDITIDTKCMKCGHNVPPTMNNSFSESFTSSGIYTSDMSLTSSFMSTRGRRSRSRSSSCARSTESYTNTLQEWKTEQWEVRNVEARRNIYEYMETEWPGETEHERTMKKGYRQVCNLLGVDHIRRIRSDRSCSVRATLFQAMVCNAPILNHLGPLSATIERLSVFNNPRYSFLRCWTFGNRLPYSKSDLVDTMAACITTLFEQLSAVSTLHSASLREDYIFTLMNQSPQVDLQLIEAVKFLMVLRALVIYESSAPSPLMAMKLRLFSRPSAANPELLVRNHINCIGDTTTAGQVEMALLGLTLGLKIEVVRPAMVGKDHFICHYPDDGADSFPRMHLLSEDDTHYSVAVVG